MGITKLFKRNKVEKRKETFDEYMEKTNIYWGYAHISGKLVAVVDVASVIVLGDRSFDKYLLEFDTGKKIICVLQDPSILKLGSEYHIGGYMVATSSSQWDYMWRGDCTFVLVIDRIENALN